MIELGHLGKTSFEGDLFEFIKALLGVSSYVVQVASIDDRIFGPSADADGARDELMMSSVSQVVFARVGKLLVKGR